MIEETTDRPPTKRQQKLPPPDPKVTMARMVSNASHLGYGVTGCMSIDILNPAWAIAVFSLTYGYAVTLIHNVRDETIFYRKQEEALAAFWEIRAAQREELTNRKK